MKRLVGGTLLALLLASHAYAAVDVNGATQAELEAVKGIGPSKAKAIIEYRQKNGPFKSLDDLVKVKGLGKSSLSKLKGELTVSDTKAEAPKETKK